MSRATGTRRWTVAQTGPREEYVAARAMARQGRLARLYTDVWWNRSVYGPRMVRKLGLRFHPELADADVLAVNTTAMARTGWGEVVRTRGRPLFNLRYGQWFDRRVAAWLERQPMDSHADAFFAFNGSCLTSLRLLRDRGIPALVDQVDPAKSQYEAVRREAERWPGWSDRPVRTPDVYFDHMEQEWEAATGVVANSPWSADSLVQQGVPRDRIAVVPLAYEPPVVPRRVAREADRPLTVLWLGSVKLVKGIPYLIEAARLLADRSIRFVVVGPIEITPTALATAPESMRFTGRVLHSQVAQEYLAADVFVLPTISDGFAITQIEAMAHGLPVVTTPNCGEVVEHGSDGFVVPACDGPALAEALARLDDDRMLVAAMSDKATAKAEEFSVERYGAALDAAVASFTGERSPST